MEIEIENKDLIKLVKERPLLWDRTTENYKNRTATKMAWDEIAVALIHNFRTLDNVSKLQATKMILQRWTHIRDNYNRSIKRMISERKTPGRKLYKPYVYSKRLTFLNKVMNVNGEDGESSSTGVQQVSLKRPDSDNTKDSDGEYETNDESDDSGKWKSFADTSKVSRRPVNDPLQATITTTTSASTDRHFSFFKCILPTLELFDDNQVLEYQMRVLKVLQNIKKEETRRMPLEANVSVDVQEGYLEVKEEMNS